MEQFNVLSVCDGMSCGQIALQELNIKVDNYFASEIDKSAIKVTRHNFPNVLRIYEVRLNEILNYKQMLVGVSCIYAVRRSTVKL